MAQALSSKLNDCRSCYKCIRNCPTKSISFRDGHASIDSEGCVLCGKCVLVCPQNAKEIRNDIEVAKELLKGDAPVYVSIAPSFLAASDWVKPILFLISNSFFMLKFYDKNM